MFSKLPLQSRKQPKRRGAAAVELAVSLPFLVAVAFGMIEYNNLVNLRTRMVSAAYESARLGARPTTSESDAATTAAVTTYCTSLLTQLGVNGATVTVSPSNLGNWRPQTLFTVSVSAPFSQNSLTTLVISSTKNVTVNATMIIE